MKEINEKIKTMIADTRKILEEANIIIEMNANYSKERDA